MHYFYPGPRLNVGDCMPFVHDGVFHFVYLIDRDHHADRDGLGGHQWAHSSSADLVHWTHHPLALAVEQEWEGSICTGSVFVHDGVYHAFFATRKRDYTQHLGHAVSDDGIHFRKLEPNPLGSAPPGYHMHDLRDPFVFRGDDGLFHMLVSAKVDPYALAGRGGCILRYTSRDLYDWAVAGPFLMPCDRLGEANVPECADYFYWNGWYYLLFGLGLRTHYRMSRHPFGPWERPANDMLDNFWNAVIKTAVLSGRQIGVGWTGEREGRRDDGRTLWGGSAVFREIVQNADGTLGTRFLPEGLVADGGSLVVVPRPLTPGADVIDRSIHFRPREGLQAAAIDGLPAAYRLRCRATTDAVAFGLRLRAQGAFEGGYLLRVDRQRRTVTLAGETVPLAGEGDGHTLDLVVRPDLIDVCLDDRQCVIVRAYDHQGRSAFLFAEDGEARFEAIEVEAVAASLRPMD